MTPTTAEIRKYMLDIVADYDDLGEVNATGLAEDACQHFDDYDDDDIPEKYFDLAASIALDYEQSPGDD